MSAGTVKMRLTDLVTECQSPLGQLQPRHLTLDSRAVEAGDVFIALPGAVADGRQFIEQAFSKGAIAVLAEADGWAANDARIVPIAGLKARLPGLAKTFYEDPSATMAIVAVTGTNGKTSVVEFIAQLLRGLGVATGTIGTLGCRLSPALAETFNTTPDVVALNRQLADWREVGVRHVAMEASSHALDQGRLQGLTLHTGIFTNLSRDHLDYHGDEQRYALAKLRLFSTFTLQRALFNADDPIASRVADLAKGRALGISLSNSDADMYVQVQGYQPLRLRLHTPLGVESMTVNLSGRFNAHNLALAVMAVNGLGQSFTATLAVANHIQPVAGRMQRVENHRQLNVVVDYAHTPDALGRALTALRSETSGRLWVVFGCGGDRDRGKRPLMAEQADNLADKLIITSDNPRNENPADIIAEVTRAMTGAFEVVIDREQAIAQALAGASPGDTVLIAGKGHENYQESRGQRRAFSDVATAERYLLEPVR